MAGRVTTDYKYDLAELVLAYPAITFGIDVSAYQGEIDWPQVATTARFAFIKAADHRQPDKMFLANWRASAGRLERGAYQVAYPVLESKRTDPARAARYLAPSGGDGELAGVLDLETRLLKQAVEVIGAEATVEWIAEWVGAYHQATGRDPMLYLSRHGAAVLGMHAVTLRELPCWWVDTGPAVGKPPRMGRGWSRWDVRQFTGAGRCPGVGGKVDLDFRA